ncbi:MAG: carbohydrate kinase family protein [Devosia sp.]|nr:carbohydrate kinase family protein [Devosia sp.]
MRSADVLLTGEYYCDLIFAGLPGAPRLGAELVARDLAVLPGGTYNIALALTRLGLDTHWAADFGSDLFSGLVLEQAARDGLSPLLFNRLDQPLRRVTSVFSAGGDRGFLTYGDGAIVPPPAGTLGKVRPTWLLQTFRFEPEWLAFMHEAKAGGAKLFADCRGGDFTLETPGVREFLSLLDVFSPNEDEAVALTGTQHPKKAAAQLAELVPIVAIKRGAAGALVSDGGRWIKVAAPEVAVKDTTGAGDTFNGGFLYGLCSGRCTEEAAELAVLAGSLSVTDYGVLAAPTLSALKKFAVEQGRGKMFLETAS